MNLLVDKWLWVHRRNGEREKIAPVDITFDYEKNPIVSSSSYRADFDGGTVRFLISFVQTFLDNSLNRLNTPPNREELLSLLKKKDINAFNVDGDGVRFMQDLEPEKLIKPDSLSSLLVGTPGANTIKDGKDFFIRGGSRNTFCPDCAAMTLYMRQVNGVMGGVGYRTAIGSGAEAPLCTFLLGDTLWETMIMNTVPRRDVFQMGGNPKGTLFPWTVPTVKSQGGVSVNQADVHPYYYLWEMPAQIYLDWEATEDVCDICGSHSSQMVKSIKKVNYGNCYKLDFNHTFYPKLTSKNGTFFKKPPKVISFLNHIEYIVPSEKNHPSPIMKNICKLNSDSLVLWTFGYIQKQALNLGWHESTYKIQPSLLNDPDLTFKIMAVTKSMAGILVGNVKGMQGAISSPEAITAHDLIINNFYNKVELDFMEALKTGDINKWLHDVTVKMLTIFHAEVGNGKIGLQIYMRESMINSINKKIVKPNDLVPLNIENFLMERIRSKSKINFFKKELWQAILSWYGRMSNVSEKRVKFSRGISIDEIMDDPDFSDLLLAIGEYYPDIEEKQKKLRLAAGVLVIFKVKGVDLENTFPAQLAKSSVHERHLRKLYTIDDVVTEWRSFLDTASQIDNVNIVSFLEGMMGWNADMKKYWRREYTKNI